MKKVGDKDLTPKQLKQCVAAYLDTGTLHGAARRTGFNVGTIKNAIRRCKNFEQLYTKKREQESKELFDSISARSDKFIEFCDLFFNEVTNPDRIKSMSRQDLEKLTRIFGIMTDKFTLVDKLRKDAGLGDTTVNINIIRKRSRDDEDEED